MNPMPFKKILVTALIAASSALALAQDSRPLRLVVPFPPGGATDAVARMLQPKLSAELSQTVVVENKPGASGQIGTAFVKNAPADGTVFLFTTDHTVVTIPHLVPSAGYVAPDDFLALGQVARYPLALSVAPATGAKNLRDFASFVKAQPAKANYGVPVIGGFPSTVGVAVARKIGAPMIAVPFPGSGPVTLNVAASQVSAGVTGLGDVLPMAKGGRVQLVAVTGTQRSPIAPDVPTFEELGYSGLTQQSWYGFLAPKATPPAIAERFNHALAKVLKDADIQHRIRELSLELAPTTLQEAAAEFKASAEFWTEAAKSPDFVRP